MMHKNTFEIIENAGQNNLRDVLRFELARASEVCIAVAFVTQPGLDKLIQSLRQVSVQGKVRLITGLYQHVTEPQALKSLLDVETSTRGNLSVRLSKEPKFHKKVYLIENRLKATVIIGSSNLTKEGVQSGGEMNLMLSLSKNSRSFKRLKQVFDKEWRGRAVPLTNEHIGLYEAARTTHIKRESFSQNELRKILGAKPIHQQANAERTEAKNNWRDSILYYAANYTQRLISETTNWDEKNYEWFSTGKRPPYQIGDRIFLFDFTVKRFSLVEVKDVTRTPISTPDGRHFVAFKQIRNYRRRFSRGFCEELKTGSLGKIKVRNAPFTKVDAEETEFLMCVLNNK